jgi:large subunit ribosomal protein L10
MSKVIKQMEMETLRNTFKGVRDLVVLSTTKLTCLGDYTLRASLRKKNIRLQVVKNSLTRKIFREMNMNIADDSPFWQGPTLLAWGGSSVAELSKEIDTELKHAKNGPLYKDKVTKKGAIADGQAVTFEEALKMPTRADAIGRVVTLALSPGRRLMGQVLSPASLVVGQIKSLKDKEGGEKEAPAAS